MIPHTALLDLHGGLGGAWDWCRPFLYPAEEDGRLRVVPVARPLFSEETLQEAAYSLRAWLERQGVRHWQLIAVLAADGAPQGPQPGPLVGQVQVLYAHLMEHVRAAGHVPSSVWAVVVDRVDREAETAMPLGPRAHALWQQDRRGWVAEGEQVPQGFCAGAFPEVFTEAEINRLSTDAGRSLDVLDDLMQAKARALDGISERAPAFVRAQLDRLCAALYETGLPTPDQMKGQAAKHLGVASLPPSVHLLRLPLQTHGETGRHPSCHLLQVVHLLQVLIGEPRVGAWFNRDAVSAYRCIQYEADEEALATALQAYQLRLEDRANRLGQAHRKEVRLPKIQDTCPPVKVPASSELEVCRLGGRGGYFQDPEHRRRWDKWLMDTQEALQKQRTLGRRAATAYMKETLKKEDEEGQPDVAGEGKGFPSLSALISERKQHYEDKYATLLAVPRPLFPMIDLREELQPVTGRLVQRFRRLPSMRRFFVTLLLAMGVVALPHFVLLGTIGTTWDVLALPVVISGLLVLTALVTLWRLRRPIHQRLNEAAEVAQRHRLNVEWVTKAHLDYVEALYHVQVARKNVELAHTRQRDLEEEYLRERYHEHTIRRIRENMDQLRQACFPEAASAADAQLGAEEASLDPRKPSLRFYAPQFHAPGGAEARPGYILQVDGAVKESEAAIFGLTSIAFEQDPAIRLWANRAANHE